MVGEWSPADVAEEVKGLERDFNARARRLWRSFRWILLGALLLTLFLLISQQAADVPFTVEGRAEPRNEADYGPWEGARFRPLRPEAANSAEGAEPRELRPLNLCFLLPVCKED